MAQLIAGKSLKAAAAKPNLRQGCGRKNRNGEAANVKIEEHKGRENGRAAKKRRLARVCRNHGCAAATT